MAGDWQGVASLHQEHMCLFPPSDSQCGGEGQHLICVSVEVACLGEPKPSMVSRDVLHTMSESDTSTRAIISGFRMHNGSLEVELPS